MDQTPSVFDIEGDPQPEGMSALFQGRTDIPGTAQDDRSRPTPRKMPFRGTLAVPTSKRLQSGFIAGDQFVDLLREITGALNAGSVAIMYQDANDHPAVAQINFLHAVTVLRAGPDRVLSLTAFPSGDQIVIEASRVTMIVANGPQSAPWVATYHVAQKVGVFFPVSHRAA